MIENNKNNTRILKWYDDDNNEVCIEVSPADMARINTNIEVFTKKIFSGFGFIRNNDNDIIEINNTYYKTKIISLFVNNFKTYQNIAKFNDIRDTESFIRYMKYNLHNQYHYSGIFFLSNYHTVEYTSDKGARGEINAINHFRNFLNLTKSENSKDIINVYPPVNVKEDVSGIDGSFIYNGIKYTVQVKPFISQKRLEGNIIVESTGSLSFNTNYLVLYKENKINNKFSYEYIILSNGSNKNLITIKDSSYITNIKNIKEF